MYYGSLKIQDKNIQIYQLIYIKMLNFESYKIS